MINKYKCNNIYFFMLIILCFFVINNIVAASENNENELGFTYENMIPKNQISDNEYFELKVKPGDKQTLVSRITNLTDEQLTIQIVISNATSSPSGIINYGSSNEKLVGKKVVSIIDIIDYPSKVVLKPKEIKDIEFKLDIPKEEFDGIILGGVQMKAINESGNNKEDIKKEKELNSIAIKNEYSYVYSISLIENDNEVIPELSSQNTAYDQTAYISLNNLSARIISDLKIETILMTEDSDKVLDEYKFENYRMAPNSNLLLPLPNTEDLDFGKYRTKTVVTLNEKIWEFDNEFEVSNKMIEEKQNDLFDNDSKQKQISWIIFFSILLLFILTSLGIYVFLNRRK